MNSRQKLMAQILMGNKRDAAPLEMLLGLNEQRDPMLGYSIRDKLYSGEDRFFQQNPNVAGMASESGHVILNPYAPESTNKDAVAKNEAMRLYMRDLKITPDFALTDEQRGQFAGTPYSKDDKALKETIAARIYSRDPSAKATPEQEAWLKFMLQGIMMGRD